MKIKARKTKYLLALVALCLVGIVALGYYYFLTTFSTATDVQYVFLDDDDDLDSVCTKLSPFAAKHAMTGFRTLSRHSGYAKAVRSGRYAIQPEESTLAVLRKLRNGQQQAVMLTIPESRTTDRLAAILSHKLMLDSATLAEAFTDTLRYRQWGLGDYDTCSIVSLFVPNTYEIYWNIGIDRFMERMKSEHDRFWQGERRDKARSLNMTENEVCTLASIIDEETANNDEKPMIAGMYLNRLKVGMPLQADPTVKYALKNFGLRRIYHDMLFYDSPYNTYRYEGLPPGPIKVASIKGIDAVLNHVAHDYLYMCAKEDFSGTHNFAVSYQEHLKNAARYARALNERGIK